MPSDAAHSSSRPTRIGLPDQLQQSSGSDPAQPAATAEPGGRVGEPDGEIGAPAPRRGGILGQLETERGHD